MMISSPSAGDPYAAAAALDRALRSDPGPGADGGPPSGDSPLQSGPDVVVSLSSGASSPPATYDASGRMGGAPTLEDMGANAPDSMAHATETYNSTDAPASASAPAAADASSVDQDAAVPA